MNRYLLSIVVCFIFKFSFTASAQNHFEPGYVINSQLDTLHGLIDYKNWNKNPEKINFKSPVSSNVVVYGLDDIVAFNVHGENYLKALVRICVSSDKDDALTYSPAPEFVETTAFLTVASTGSKNLYYMRDQRQKLQLFVGNAPGEYDLLINYRYKINTSAGSSIMAQTRYKEQLKNFFADCPDITSNLKGMTYSEQSVSKLFSEYYAKCSKEVQKISYQPERFTVQWGVLAGFTSSKLAFVSTGLQYLDDLKFPWSSGASGGLSLNIVVPRTQKRFSIYNDLTFSYNKPTYKFQDYVSDQRYSLYTASMGLGYLKLTNMVRYKVQAGHIGLFVNLGVSQGMVITQANKIRTETVFYTEKPVVTEEKLLDSIRKYEQGLVGGVGGAFKNYGVELRYEKSNGMSDYANLNSKVNRLSILLSYTF